MSRRRFIVAYDIRDPVRLRRVYSTMKGFGHSLQYSVFICDLDAMEAVGLRTALGNIILHTADSVIIVELGDPATKGTECFEFLGQRRHLPHQGSTVI